MTNKVITDRDMRSQVIKALDGREDEFDVAGIVDAVQREFGTTYIDVVPAARFWAIVERNEIV